MDLGASVLDARFERFDERVGNVLVSRRGNLLPAVPERMATAWLYWRPATAWTLGLGGRAVGRSAGNNANTVFLPGYATVDLLARYEHAWGQFGLRLRNVGDKLYATRPYNAANQFMLGEPRWYELSWQRSF